MRLSRWRIAGRCGRIPCGTERPGVEEAPLPTSWVGYAGSMSPRRVPSGFGRERRAGLALASVGLTTSHRGEERAFFDAPTTIPFDAWSRRGLSLIHEDRDTFRPDG